MKGKTMKVGVGKQLFDFRPWRPGDGRVFSRSFALDTETTAIDQDRPWITPAYVIGAAFDGRQGVFVLRRDVSAFLAAHKAQRVVFHNAPFDLAVLQLVVGNRCDLYSCVERNLVWDTQLLHRLHMLGSEGHVAAGKGQSTLDHCAEHYLGIVLPKNLVDSKGRPVRTSYGRWLNRPPQEIEPIYLEYLAKDVIITYQLYRDLLTRIRRLFEEKADTIWGYVSPRWLKDQIGQWGWQTHHIQLRGAIVLQQITANGLAVDIERRAKRVEELGQVHDELLDDLREWGYLPGTKGCNTALQRIVEQLENESGLPVPKTPTDKYSTSEKSLAMLGEHPFVEKYLKFKAVDKLRNNFLKKMGRRRLHPSFNVLGRSGRTSSFGEINAQNLPRDDRVRSCIRADEIHVLLAEDYKTIELATLGQACLTQFDLESEMAAAINEGKDLHRMIAAKVAGIPEHEVDDERRQKAKVVSFGKPGGMGNATLQKYAKNSYGVDLSEQEVQRLSDAWFAAFPEMKDFLTDDHDLGGEIAELFQLTPLGHFRHTNNRKFIDHPNNAGRERRPHPILGGMCLKVLRCPEPRYQDGRPYDSDDVDFFWKHVAAKLSLVPSEFRGAIRERRASERLQRAIMRLVGRGGVFTLTGRLRANATYSARHNCVFQGLAADGAKLALWLIWRAGYRIVNFVHDEVIIEIAQTTRKRLHAEIIRHLMIVGMKAVVPDVQVDIEYAMSTHWYKKAKPRLDSGGRLTCWHPKSDTKK